MSRHDERRCRRKGLRRYDANGAYETWKNTRQGVVRLRKRRYYGRTLEDWIVSPTDIYNPDIPGISLSTKEGKNKTFPLKFCPLISENNMNGHVEYYFLDVDKSVGTIITIQALRACTMLRHRRVAVAI